MKSTELPLPRPAPDVLDDEWAAALCTALAEESTAHLPDAGEFAQCPVHQVPAPGRGTALGGPLPGDPLDSAAGLDGLRHRLRERAAKSATAALGMLTWRAAAPAPGPACPEGIGRGVRQSVLSPAPPGTPGVPGRPGEAWQVRRLSLAPGAHWRMPAPWGKDLAVLVLDGQVAIDGMMLDRSDFALRRRGVGPAPDADLVLHSPGGGELYWRESLAPQGGAGRAGAAPGSLTVRRWADAPWQAHGPGVHRALLWQDGMQAAFLIHALPGASVPAHAHHHDEECLMLDGELFADDVLLRRGDYQLAPAGTRHRSVVTDTGVLVYFHGDLDLAVDPA